MGRKAVPTFANSRPLVLNLVSSSPLTRQSWQPSENAGAQTISAVALQVGFLKKTCSLLYSSDLVPSAALKQPP